MRCMSYLRKGLVVDGRSATGSEERSPLQKYATTFWPYYARCAGDRGAELLLLDVALLQDSNVLLAWLKSYKRTGPRKTSSLMIGADGQSLSLVHLASFLGIAAWIPMLLTSDTVARLDQSIPPRRNDKTEIVPFAAQNILEQAAVFNAVQEGYEDVIRLLLGLPDVSTAADLNIRSNTSLHYATSRSMVKVLLQAGANIDAANNQENTPLMEAAKRDEEVTLALLEAKANVHFAKNQSISQALLNAGANVNAATTEELRPCTTASSDPRRSCSSRTAHVWQHKQLRATRHSMWRRTTQSLRPSCPAPTPMSTRRITLAIPCCIPSSDLPRPAQKRPFNSFFRSTTPIPLRPTNTAQRRCTSLPATCASMSLPASSSFSSSITQIPMRK